MTLLTHKSSFVNTNNTREGRGGKNPWQFCPFGGVFVADKLRLVSTGSIRHRMVGWGDHTLVVDTNTLDTRYNSVGDDEEAHSSYFFI
jgi:hypothetical protein